MILQTLASQLRLLLSIPKGNDIYVFFQYANKMKSGQLPYIGFHPEYPPFAFFFLYFPYFFTKDSLFYEFLFGIEVFIAISLRTYILWLWTKNIQKIWLFLLLLMIMQASAYQLVFARFDIFVAVLCMTALYLFLQVHKESAGWFFLFLGVMTKVYPLILIPLMMYKAKNKSLVRKRNSPPRV